MYIAMMLILIILFLLSKTQNYMFLLQLYQQDTFEKLTKILSKGFERSVYWNEYKTKNENKNTTAEFRYFLELNFVVFNRLFVLVYTN